MKCCLNMAYACEVEGGRKLIRSSTHAMSTLRALATKTLGKYSARKHCLLKVVGEQVRMYCQMHKSEL